jgi:hypothetical protein
MLETYQVCAICSSSHQSSPAASYASSSPVAETEPPRSSVCCEQITFRRADSHDALEDSINITTPCESRKDADKHGNVRSGIVSTLSVTRLLISRCRAIGHTLRRRLSARCSNVSASTEDRSHSENAICWSTSDNDLLSNDRSGHRWPPKPVGARTPALRYVSEVM